MGSVTNSLSAIGSHSRSIFSFVLSDPSRFVHNCTKDPHAGLVYSTLAHAFATSAHGSGDAGGYFAALDCARVKNAIVAGAKRRKGGAADVSKTLYSAAR